jgi:hypothetical protein
VYSEWSHRSGVAAKSRAVEDTIQVTLQRGGLEAQLSAIVDRACCGNIDKVIMSFEHAGWRNFCVDDLRGLEKFCSALDRLEIELALVGVPSTVLAALHILHFPWIRCVVSWHNNWRGQLAANAQLESGEVVRSRTLSISVATG